MPGMSAMELHGDLDQKQRVSSQQSRSLLHFEPDLVRLKMLRQTLCRQQTVSVVVDRL